MPTTDKKGAVVTIPIIDHNEEAERVIDELIKKRRGKEEYEPIFPTANGGQQWVFVTDKKNQTPAVSATKKESLGRAALKAGVAGGLSFLLMWAMGLSYLYPQPGLFQEAFVIGLIAYVGVVTFTYTAQYIEKIMDGS